MCKVLNKSGQLAPLSPAHDRGGHVAHGAIEGITRQRPAMADHGAVIHRAAIRGNGGTGQFGTVCNTRQWQATDAKMLPYPSVQKSGILGNTRQSPATEGKGGSRASAALVARAHFMSHSQALPGKES